jgi:hypothetical protein
MAKRKTKKRVVSKKMDKTEKCMVSLDRTDMFLLKLTSMAFILFLITLLPSLMNLVHRIHWGWFLGATLIFMLRPFMKYLNA